MSRYDSIGYCIVLGIIAWSSERHAFHDSRESRLETTQVTKAHTTATTASTMNIPAANLLGAKGTQRLLRETFTYDKAHAELSRLRLKAKWGKSFRIGYRIVTQPIGEARMVCVDCNKELSGSNPCSTFKTSFNCGSQQPLSQQPRGDSTDSAAGAVLSKSAAGDGRGPAGGQPKLGQIVPGW
jgi:hypothetical protein